jgi:predicted acyltransferase
MKNICLDVYRGLMVAGMIVVESKKEPIAISFSMQ